MEGVYVIVGALVGFLASIITAKITSHNHLKSAELNAKKELEIHHSKMIREDREECCRKLERLHIILSKIAMENSQTISIFQSDGMATIGEFRIRYLNNCELLYEAQAITDLYLSQSSETIRKIFGQMNMYWGSQENLMRIDIKENMGIWDRWMAEVLKAVREIALHTRNVQYDIVNKIALIRPE